jgi:hypothetical protein
VWLGDELALWPPAMSSPSSRKCLHQGPKTLSGCDAGESAIPVIVAKRDPHRDTLQDLALSEVPQNQLITLNGTGHVAEDFSPPEPSRTLSGGALQDLACVQVPLLAGIVSLLIGNALQDRFATFTRELVDRGKTRVGH